MISILASLYGVLTKKQRHKIIRLQLLVILMSLFEIAGVAMILPLMSVVADSSIIQRDEFLGYLYNLFNSESDAEFLVLLSLFFVFFIFLSTIVSIYTTWKLLLFGNQTGIEISDSLLSYYLRKDWMYLQSVNSSKLTSNIFNDAARVTHQIIMPIVRINAKAFTIIFLLIGLILVDPVSSLAGVLVFSVIYLAIFKNIKKRMLANGENISESNKSRYKIISESLEGAGDLKLTASASFFLDRFRKEGERLYNSHAVNATLSQVPRFTIEFVAFSTIVSILIYLLTNDDKLHEALPLLSFYALAALKLIPSFQQLYHGFSNIKGAEASFNEIILDLQHISEKSKFATSMECDKHNVIQIEQSIRIKDVSFSYDGLHQVLRDFNLYIQKGKSYAVIGKSGSGKSTLVNILLGLLKPQSGEILVDNKKINIFSNGCWLESVGYVRQDTFLLDASFAENIAFGVSREEIDFSKLERVITQVFMDDFVASLPNGLDAVVGERGAKLSGGQKQRLGIARALYRDCELYIFDEITSALDTRTQEAIFETIKKLQDNGKTLLYITHDLSSLDLFDEVHKM